MAQAASKILGTVNAPYGAPLTASRLAECISDVEAAQTAMGPVFFFLSEVAPELQTALIADDGPVRARAA